MYTHLLSSVIDDWVDDLGGDALVHYARARRSEMLAVHRASVGHYRAASCFIVLEAEIVYDRALLKLCDAYGIDTSPERFSYPIDERRRLEEELVAIGADLTTATPEWEAP